MATLRKAATIIFGSGFEVKSYDFDQNFGAEEPRNIAMHIEKCSQDFNDSDSENDDTLKFMVSLLTGMIPIF